MARRINWRGGGKRRRISTNGHALSETYYDPELVQRSDAISHEGWDEDLYDRMADDRTPLDKGLESCLIDRFADLHRWWEFVARRSQDVLPEYQPLESARYSAGTLFRHKSWGVCVALRAMGTNGSMQVMTESALKNLALDTSGANPIVFPQLGGTPMLSAEDGHGVVLHHDTDRSVLVVLFPDRGLKELAFRRRREMPQA